MKFNYSLDNYSFTKAFFWGNTQDHWRKSHGELNGHRIIAIVEAIPIIGQIASLFEWVLVSLLKDKSTSLPEQLKPIDSTRVKPFDSTRVQPLDKTRIANFKTVVSEAPVLTAVQVRHPLITEEMALSTFTPKSWLLGIGSSICPDNNVIDAVSKKGLHKNAPHLYESIVESLNNAWKDHADQLLDYVNQNIEALYFMFDQKPLWLSVDLEIGVNKTKPLSPAQIKLLELLPITILILSGDVSNESSIEQIQETMPKMTKLTCVHADCTRFLKEQFYKDQDLQKITIFSVRIEAYNIKLLKNLPNLKKLFITFENQSYYSVDNTRTLLDLTHLEELTLDGSRMYKPNDITECLKNLPQQCRKLRLDSIPLNVDKFIDVFKDRPLETLCLVNYPKDVVNSLRDANIARKIIIWENMPFVFTVGESRMK